MDSCGLLSLMRNNLPLGQNQSNSVSLIIREAQLQDIKGLTEVLSVSFHPPQGWLLFLQPLLKLGIYEDLRSRLRGKAPYYCCLVAVEVTRTTTVSLEKIVGTIELSLRTGFNSHYLYISNLAVIESHRRQGIARCLLHQCEEIASKWGHDALNLHVLEHNEGAKQLYLQNGYQVSAKEPTWPSWLFSRSSRLFLQKKIQTNV